MSLHTDAGWAVLEIDDDGKGFDAGSATGPGQGLRNLGERAQSLGGDLNIHSEAAEGTTVRIRLPL